MSDNKMESPGQLLLKKWGCLSNLSVGKWIFSRMLGWMVPYTGSLGAQITELKPGHARVILKERRKVRNHLRCIHAIALSNLGELASGLAMLTAQPDGVRGIVTSIQADYLHKARGTLFAQADLNPKDVRVDQGSQEYKSVAKIFDQEDNHVCTVTATWLLEKKI
ncbi:MAG: hotdog fold domain-containing protein [bacterium]